MFVFFQIANNYQLPLFQCQSKQHFPTGLNDKVNDVNNCRKIPENMVYNAINTIAISLI